MYESVTSIPSANILLSSLRSVGYIPETAIADIVDNSLSANASVVKIEFDWDINRIIITDNGDGMSNEDLIKSMSIGSSDPLDLRSIHDLGRFGMGMKTASFSLGKKLTVLSKCSSDLHNACWDLDYVRQEDKWQILIEDINNPLISLTVGPLIMIPFNNIVNKIVKGEQLILACAGSGVSGAVLVMPAPVDEQPLRAVAATAPAATLPAAPKSWRLVILASLMATPPPGLPAARSNWSPTTSCRLASPRRSHPYPGRCRAWR